MNIVIYDLEIKKAILGRGEKPIPGIEYCGGWTDYKGMGVSVLEAYNTVDQMYYTFLDDNIKGFQELIDKADCVAGYNNISFDNNVVAAQGINIPDVKNYDLMREALKGAGYGDQTTRMAGYKLDTFCEVNLGAHKTEDGAMAPVMWQRGQFGRVIQYCRWDTRLTVDLIKKVCKERFLLDPVTRKNITIKTPKEVISAKRAAMGMAGLLN